MCVCVFFFPWPLSCVQSEEAREQYRACVAEASARRRELANAKTDILTQIRELIFQCDLTLKAVSVQNRRLWPLFLHLILVSPDMSHGPRLRNPVM